MDNVTLQIEHSINDVATWYAAFDRFAEVRREAGVRTETVQQPVDDANFVDIALGFDDAPAAERFLDFFEQTVWSNTAYSPALAGKPVTRSLRPITASDRAPAR